MGCHRVADNVFGLAEGGEFKVQMFILVQMLNRIPMLKCSTNAPLLANPCWRFGLFIMVSSKLQNLKIFHILKVCTRKLGNEKLILKQRKWHCKLEGIIKNNHLFHQESVGVYNLDPKYC